MIFLSIKNMVRSTGSQAFFLSEVIGCCSKELITGNVEMKENGFYFRGNILWLLN